MSLLIFHTRNRFSKREKSRKEETGAGLHKSADEAPRTKGVSHFCFSYNTYSNERVRSGWGELGKELVLAGWMGSVLELLVSLFFTFSLVAATFGWLAPLFVWGSVWLDRDVERK